jgi:hypothetical protein
MDSDPFYRQLVKVMQESGREGMCSRTFSNITLATTTRQSARYKDEIQSTRPTQSSVVKPKPKKKYKIEFPVTTTHAKELTIFSWVAQWTRNQELVRLKERAARISHLQKRIQSLRAEQNINNLDVS